MADLINCLFQFGGGFVIALSCWRLHRDKQVHGVSLWHAAFFSAWGFWNLYFYPAVGAWISFIGGIGIVTMNTIYAAMIVYYLRSNDVR